MIPDPIFQIENGKATAPTKTGRTERYGSCLTELEEQTWTGPLGSAMDVGDPEETDETV